MKSLRRVRTRSQRGYVLISAIVLAILYFALMELMLIDSSRSLQQAQRFRSRIVAQALAESAAELSAVNLVGGFGTNIDAEDEQGKMTGKSTRTSTTFVLEGAGTTTGVMPATATVRIQGTIQGSGPSSHLTIDYAFHSQ